MRPLKPPRERETTINSSLGGSTPRLARSSRSAGWRRRRRSSKRRTPGSKSRVTYRLGSSARGSSRVFISRSGIGKEPSRTRILAAARIRRNLPTVFATVAGYVGAVEVYLAEWERARREGRDTDGPRKAARSSLLALWALALNIPIGKPYFFRIRGRERRIAGAERASRRAFESALLWARRLEMPYEEALAHAELATVSAAGSRERRESSATCRIDVHETEVPGQSGTHSRPRGIAIFALRRVLSRTLPETYS